METKIYNTEGKEVGNVSLPENIFGLPWNGDLVHQVVVSAQSNQRTPVAHTKDRSEVRGGGKKPWRQKGTGSARHGSRRSPIWRGGGITFGPRNDKDYTKKINKKMKAKALFTVLSQKLKDNEIIFLDNISFAEPKSARAKEIIASLSLIKGFNDLSKKRKNAALFSLGIKDKNTEKSFNNFGNISVDEARNLDPLELLTYKYLIFSNPENVVKFLESKFPVKTALKDDVKTDKFKTEKKETIKTKINKAKK